MFDLTGKSKWDAWNSVKGKFIYFLFIGTTKEDAQLNYIAKLLYYL